MVETVRGERGDVAAAADYFSVPARMVQAAVDYYAEFGDEIDVERAEALAFAVVDQQPARLRTDGSQVGGGRPLTPWAAVDLRCRPAA